MAVFQIARIQIRRGQANQGTGIPQLASGEMAWAVDTQELYIGNGSVAEGAPAVGNTRLLTLNDLKAEGNLLALTQYSYKQGDSTIITGADASSPIFRSVQTRLDDQITSADFGMIGDGITDDTDALQNAIYQLFLNPSNLAHSTTSSGILSRLTLMILPGTYLITRPVYIPSFATIVGSGIDKTIIKFLPATGNTLSAFRFVNDNTTISVASVISSSQFTNQPRNIKLNDITISLPSGVNSGMQLDAVRDSSFENIKISGNTSNYTTYNSTNIGMSMNVLSNVVTCLNNIFKNIQFLNVTTAVLAKQDILNNTFEDCLVNDALQGFAFGVGSDGSSTGEQFGPRQTTISSVKFYKIKQQAVYIERGTYNTVINCKLYDVGNNNAGNAFAIYPQIYFKNTNNSAENNQSDRGADLANFNLTTRYVPAISGNVSYTSFGVRQLDLAQANTVLAFRLPISTDPYGIPTGSASYRINYVYKSITTGNFTRTGTIHLSTDISQKYLQLSDEYDFAGVDTALSVSTKLTFYGKFLDAIGNVYTGAAGQVISNVAIYYTNTLSNDVGRLNYSYSATVYTN
jgi:hypothetical protein